MGWDTTAQKVLGLVVRGFSAREIARRLRLSEEEIRSALRRALREIRSEDER